MRPILLCLLVVAGLAFSASCRAQPPLPAEEVGVAGPVAWSPHLLWVNDIAFPAMPDGRAMLVDADTGRMLGMISGGYGHNSLLFSPDGRRIYNTETYYARGTRGARTDVITIYDAGSFTPLSEIVIPPKRFLSMPLLANQRLMDDGRLAVVYNFTPSQTVSVADVRAGRMLAEFDTPGCSLIFPLAARRFAMLCADGGLLDVELGDDGRPVLQEARAPFFDADRDPLFEKPVFGGRRWMFLSFSGAAYALSLKDGKAAGEALGWRVAAPDSGWRPGGIQPLAFHAPSGRLFVLMHQGGPGTHKDPGMAVRVFDAATGRKLAEWPLAAPATSIAVSPDADDPLLYAALIGDPNLRVYSAKDGSLRRTIPETGITTTILQPVPPPAGEGAR
ncbi:MAG: hypothetical protein KatS3mg119_1267 [Rhodothalassiaceae bacterium]|nr:MAG: hypothetical protein KatS3mg119_1267 [Rhodothalassiaceae bacterium]